MYFSAKDIKSLFYSQNEYKLLVMEVEEQCKKLNVEIVHLKDELKCELSKEIPNIEEITSKILEEKLDIQQKKFEYERE